MVKRWTTAFLTDDVAQPARPQGSIAAPPDLLQHFRLDDRFARHDAFPERG